jgi:uncharacterized protein YbjT (DUF2867 family)
VRIAVVGGTGTAAAAVVDELTGRGHDVGVLSRRAPDGRGRERRSPPPTTAWIS